jgi:thymidylate synthase ThyX
MGYACRVVCDSLSPDGVRLTTVEATFPRFILAEVNTHKMISKSSASSRAIPVEKRIKMVDEDPFIPTAFGKNQKGMQSTETLDGDEHEQALGRWARACADAKHHAGILAKLGVHKQYANRLLEPFCWHTAVLTATEWSNFFGLRCHPDAQPEFQTIARMMRDAMAESKPKEIGFGEWHLPYVRDVDEANLSAEWSLEKIAKISCARSGRVSYLTQEGKRDPMADLDLYERYLSSFHMSPLEHAATPYNGGSEDEDTAEAHMHVAVFSASATDTSIIPMVGNLRGWVQQRKLIPNEHDFSLRGAP